MAADPAGRPPRFAGRTAIVTGGTRGIGRAVAETIVAEGGRVCVTGLDGDRLRAAVSELGGPETACGVAGSVDDAAHRQAVVAHAVERFGAVDLLVNNAGTLVEAGPLMDVDLDRFRATIEINLMGTLGFAQAVWHAGMRERGGAIVNVSSLSGLRVFPGQAAYTVTKAAILQLTRQLALDMAPGVRVNAVAPGVTRTDAGREHWEGREDMLAREFPLRRIGEPADVAAAVTHLLSDEAAWTTGETILLDGGWSLLSQSTNLEQSG